MSDERPIGVFDSGVGGLTVLRALRDRLPEESCIYLGDTARVPYGTKSEDTVRHFAAEAGLLLQEQGVKAMVVACNTASAVALNKLRSILTIPVYGVIQPGVDAALKVTKGHVGIIGTLATIGSGRYTELLKIAMPSLQVESQACPLFVPLAEEGWVEGEIAEAIAERYLAEIRDKNVDTLILGCTHYPILKNAIGKVMGDKVCLVDSALVLADAVADDLAAKDALHPGQSNAELRVLASDVPQRFEELCRRFLNADGLKVELVDLEAKNLPQTRTESD